MRHPLPLNASRPAPSSASPWLVRFGQRPVGPRLCLYCFPYAGGSAGIYQPWRAKLDPDIDLVAVQMPARGARMVEPAMRDLPEIVQRLTEVVTATAGVRFAFFGHSLGALVAFELTRYLEAHQLPTPVKLIVSGASGPQTSRDLEPLDENDDDKLIQRLSRYKGTPPEILQHRELMRLMGPAIRADFALAGNYVYRAGPQLPMPITVFAGTDDEEVDAEQALAWQRETCASFKLHTFDGDHFFIHHQQQAVVARLNAELAPITLLNEESRA
jgi:medium-chain acyl-[acyl-carrier-protein] hydrolase